jgi:hypothetical protein
MTVIFMCLTSTLLSLFTYFMYVDVFLLYISENIMVYIKYLLLLWFFSRFEGMFYMWRKVFQATS